ncbi:MULTISPECIES: MsnO8 family LLM class oxidoreductase [unclassified Arthrobacter]|uniref:MsnO8 family LLM class oxidoreductase n=1 Tax=unclassified Arthrobacter TaxID=235627 RepID=UPI001491AF95|nr:MULTISPECIES: MsnO8 family LLM class oxidoreductase [unclassified Arthrobacter]MBE0010251.1 MsnO8 family LLM class oxidoreductase [Arthrobacter sp. AET 35A]NOJ64128.1 MsnO8 family LLM class oxidoreductase [Arthrobacter sp. 147(2020)]
MALPLLRISILDRANARDGFSASDALNRVLERAQRAAEWGYHRFWVAEHHAVPGIAGSVPAVLMAAVAARTHSIRVGSGGIMLPNHRPLLVAEQAATLEALHPGRIDLGVGRSVGFTPAVRDALRAGKQEAEEFEDHLAQLLAYLSGAAAITARPRNDSATPVFVLATGSGIDIAARAGLGVVLGGPAVFRTDQNGTFPALDRYRTQFRPSRWFERPYIMVSANVAVAATRQAARELLLPEAVALARSRTTGEFAALAPVSPTEWAVLTLREKEAVERSLSTSIYGTASEVWTQIQHLLATSGADELLITGGAFDVAAQAESDRLLAGIFLQDERRSLDDRPGIRAIPSTPTGLDAT